MFLEEFSKKPFMGILRGVESSQLPGIVEIYKSLGLKALEITMNTPNAGGLIAELRELAGDSFYVGAGTVLSKDDMSVALHAGAQFIVSPTFVPEVMDYCHENEIPYFPGAFTPQEVLNAWNAGATMVKLFPAKFLGPEYVKELKAPLNKVKLMVCGGVNEDTVGEFFKAGADAVAFGASIFRAEWLENGDFSQIEQGLKKIL